MSKHKKHKIKIFFKDGKCDIIPQKFWDDYEINGDLFFVKKNETMVAFYNIDIIACVVVW